MRGRRFDSLSVSGWESKPRPVRFYLTGTQHSENCGQRLWTDLQKSTVFRERDGRSPIWGSKPPLETRASPQFFGGQEHAETSAEAASSALPLGSGKPERDSFDTDSMVEEALLRIELSPDVDEVRGFDPE